MYEVGRQRRSVYLGGSNRQTDGKTEGGVVVTSKVVSFQRPNTLGANGASAAFRSWQSSSLLLCIFHLPHLEFTRVFGLLSSLSEGQSTA